MSDLISRQAAIDDIWTVSPLARLDRKWVDRWLRQLPPAQPTFDARDTQYNLPIGTDLISRQAAIDALCHVDEYNGRSIEAIRQLPSAQPEVIKCKDCKHYWIHKCMDSMPIERCDLEQTFYDAEHDFCSLAEKREVTT